MQSPRLDIKADLRVVKELDRIKEELGAESRTGVIALLIREHETKDRGFPPVMKAVMDDTRPVIITGPSGSGKTYSTAELIKGTDKVLVVAPELKEPEYTFPRVVYSQVSAVDWTQTGCYLCIVASDVSVSQIEANLAFRALSLEASKGSLREWVLVVEEAHRYIDDETLKSLILEARKTTRKLIVLTATPGPWMQLAPCYAPLKR